MPGGSALGASIQPVRRISARARGRARSAARQPRQRATQQSPAEADPGLGQFARCFNGRFEQLSAARRIQRPRSVRGEPLVGRPRGAGGRRTASCPRSAACVATALPSAGRLRSGRARLLGGATPAGRAAGGGLGGTRAALAGGTGRRAGGARTGSRAAFRATRAGGGSCVFAARLCTALAGGRAGAGLGGGLGRRAPPGRRPGRGCAAAGLGRGPALAARAAAVLRWRLRSARIVRAGLPARGRPADADSLWSGARKIAQDVARPARPALAGVRLAHRHIIAHARTRRLPGFAGAAP
jgi:hypothetical protein